MGDPKQKQSPSLREPKLKKKLGLSVPQPLRMPHEDLVRQMPEPSRPDLTSLPSETSLPIESSQVSKTSLDSDQAGAWTQTSQTLHTRQPSKTSQTKTRGGLMSNLPDV